MSSNKLRRPPQLALRLDASLPDVDKRWHDGATITCLGRELKLHLRTQGKVAEQEDNILHLPLPPQASPRQIQDSAEAWLRQQGLHYLNALVTEKSALAGRRAPAISLSFSSQAHWIDVQEPGALRCNWRLLEQPPATIEVTISRALDRSASLTRPEMTADLFGALPA